MKASYKIPTETSIGHVHLKVSNLKRSLEFYCDLLGFEITTMYGTEAAFISAGGYHHHIGLNTWYSADYPKASEKGVGLFHTAIRYPTRKDLVDAAENLRFEEAARIRDRIKALEAGEVVSADDKAKTRKPQKGRYRKKR